MKMNSFHLSRFFISAALLITTVPGYSADVAFERDSSLPVVNINVAFKAGSVTDPKSKSGLTNFMGEMLLRGTQTRTKKKIELALDQMGAKLDFETRAESIILRGSVLSSQLEPYLKLLSEVITRPNFPENEIKKLKSEISSVIQEELGHDGSLGSRAFSKYLFQGHPYGSPILGRIPDLKSFAKADILGQYQRLMREPLLLIVGSGDTTEERITQWATDLGKTLASREAQQDYSIYPQKIDAPKIASRRRLLIIDKPDRTQTQINLGQIGILMTDPNYFKLYVGNYALGGHSFSSILMQEIRVKRGWSYGANSAFRFGLQPRTWLVHLFPAAKDTPDALAYTLKIMDEIKKDGISADRFEFAKKSLVNSSGFMYNTPSKRVENTLLERSLNLPKGFMKSHSEQITSLRLDDVNQALKSFVRPENLTITVVGTAKDLKTGLSKASGIKEDLIDVEPYDAE